MKKIFNKIFAKFDNSTIENKIRRKTLLSFSFFGLMIFIVIVGWKNLLNQPKVDGVLKPLRTTLINNEKIVSATVYSNKNLAPTYPFEKAARQVRVNGNYGLQIAADTTNWKLKIVRKPGDTLMVTLAEIKALPKTELTYNFKCIEGWCQISNWGGVLYSVFAKKYGLPIDSAYAGLETPDDGYYVGIDMPSMMHPQTLLCYEMNGKPLPLNQGYPLRLIIPVKYGVKNIKRIGTIFFSNSPPPDYWAERGYDYYSGL